jgi:hypothetical protein
MGPKTRPVIQRILTSALLLFSAAGLISHPAAAQTNWSNPIIISGDNTYSWFPDIAPDPYGGIHVTWCESTRLEDGGELEQILYSFYDGRTWSSPNDLVPPNRDIARNAIAADQDGVLHMVYGGTANNVPLRFLYSQSQVRTAWSAKSWSPPEMVNLGISYAGDIDVDSNKRLHIIYDDVYRQAGDTTSTNLSDIYYRQSDDNGITWSRSLALFPESSTGSARTALHVDEQDILHVTWDEGWDRLTGTTGGAFHGIYMSSADGGATWSTAKVIDTPVSSVAQLTAGSNNRGGVMLVWRSVASPDLYYQWSPDGKTWQDPVMFLTLNARPFSSPFDRYEMATDSGGNIHLIAVGSLIFTPTVLGVYHMVWDGQAWSQPDLIYQDTLRAPEYPRIKVSQGNLVHAAWFTRELDANGAEIRHVWYARTQTTSPRRQAKPIPTLEPTVTVTPTAEVQPTSTISPSPTRPIVFPTQSPPPWPGLPTVYTENDYILVLAFILAPVVILLLILFAYIRLKRSR